MKTKLLSNTFIFIFFLRSDLAYSVDYKIRVLVFNLSD